MTAPDPGILQRLDEGGRNATPFVVTIFLVLVSLIPTHIPALSLAPPLYVVIAVYHWTLFRPDLMPPVAVFFVGLLQDVLGGGPIGFFAFVLLLVYGSVLSQRRFLYGKSFAVVWLGFLFVGLGASIAIWLLGCLNLVTLLPLRPFFHQYLMTVALFPLVAWLLVTWERMVLREE
ncbi:MAG: rod shape-determining protein MreD [Magnetospiraceae bacterium]